MTEENASNENPEITAPPPAETPPVAEIPPVVEPLEVEEIPVANEPEPEEVETVETEMLFPPIEEQPRHKNLFAAPMYIGHPDANPDNPIMEHMGDNYDTNKNKENR